MQTKIYLFIFYLKRKKLTSILKRLAFVIFGWIVSVDSKIQKIKT